MLWSCGLGVVIGALGAALRALFPMRALWQTGVHDYALGLLLAVLFYGAVTVHELGHALAGHLVRFKVLSVTVGVLIVDRRGVRLTSVPMAGGFAVAGLQKWDGDEAFRQQFAWFVAAGPAASIVVGAVGGMVAYRLAASGAATPLQPLAASLWIGSMISVVLGLYSLVPKRISGGMTSDGEKLKRLARSPHHAIIAGQLAAFTQRPRDWDERLLARVREDIPRDARDAIDGWLLLSYHYLDSGDPSRARDAIQQAIDCACEAARTKRGRKRLGPSIGMRLAIEASLFEAAWRGDFKAAGQWLARSEATPVDMLLRRSLRSAFAAAAKGRGDPSAAVRAVAERLARSGLPVFQNIRATTIERLAKYAEPERRPTSRHDLVAG